MPSTGSISLLRCVLITLARNEEENIGRTIESMVAQTVRPLKWVIVNDGSTDSTPAIIDRYTAAHEWIDRLDMPAHSDRNFAAKAHCFNAATERVSGLQY